MIRRPYIDSVTGQRGEYIVRPSRMGEPVGTVEHAGDRSWAARCHECRSLIATGSTRVGAARKLLEHAIAAHEVMVRP